MRLIRRKDERERNHTREGVHGKSTGSGISSVAAKKYNILQLCAIEKGINTVDTKKGQGWGERCQ